MDRPAAAALGFKARLAAGDWQAADARYHGKSWEFRRRFPENHTVDCGSFVLPVAPKPFGHLGFFPEQVANWQWLFQKISAVEDPPIRALNLFAYTGGSTLAMVAAGATVTHVDASKPAVTIAREALVKQRHLNQEGHRFLVEDVPAFIAREIRRKRCYRVIVLDPPAYGHGPNGKPWVLERDLWSLLEGLVALAAPASIWLVTGHSPEVQSSDITRWLEQRTSFSLSLFEQGPMTQTAVDGRVLNAGWYVRVGEFLPC